MPMPGESNDVESFGSVFMVVWIIFAVLAVLSFIVACFRSAFESSSDSPTLVQYQQQSEAPYTRQQRGGVYYAQSVYDPSEAARVQARSHHAIAIDHSQLHATSPYLVAYAQPAGYGAAMHAISTHDSCSTASDCTGAATTATDCS